MISIEAKNKFLFNKCPEAKLISIINTKFYVDCSQECHIIVVVVIAKSYYVEQHLVISVTDYTR